MSETAARSRQERLAAKLRENLRRRKVQARALDVTGAAQPCTPEAGDSADALSKERPSR